MNEKGFAEELIESIEREEECNYNYKWDAYCDWLRDQEDEDE